MTDEELQKLVQHVSIESFHLPFRHRAVFNPRLRTTGGRYLLSSHCLEFNKHQLLHFGIEEFIKIIKHELCHYHLHLGGGGYKHRDSDFKKLLRQVGGSRYCGAIPGMGNSSVLQYIYHCRRCGASFIRRRRLDTRRYVCAACGGKIQLMKQEKRAERNDRENEQKG
ncbi:SprT family protein [Sporolactobacillus sp. CQH2019]|uniref:SprT family protein n=1 Tax=Sporolactobacillus sp. CQH2019 TaxID=3023512 RepID=UPI0023681D4F|nr:SprT family protein [Sporolactobacillus sp. CQH2019]MDD9150767.1 SprT family protein [Sporolactobacillus sp. CQH2019]